MSKPYGVEVWSPPSLSSIIGSLERSPADNLVLRVGRVDGLADAPWCQTEHVVLSPAEVERFVSEIRSLGFLQGELHDVPAESTASTDEAFSGDQS